MAAGQARQPVIFLMGPTASGKTQVSLALARHLPIEVVSVDSAQVYCGMDVGTAKPDAATRTAVPHHLIDIVSPTQAYSAGRFRDDALRLIGEIHARGNLPVLCGGTMLYFRTLTQGLAELPAAQPVLRASLEKRAAIEGWPALHAELREVDPPTAARIEPNDAQRIQRALEIYRVSGKPMSALIKDTAIPVLGFSLLKVSLEPADRAVLHERIALRFREMLSKGLVAELETLRALHAFTGEEPAMRAVGYRQAWETLEGRAPRETLEARGIAATRQLAKRQLTWLRSMEGVERFDALRGDLDAAVVGRVESFVQQGAQSSP